MFEKRNLNCCWVTQSYPTLCNAMDCSTPGSLSFITSWSLLNSCPLSWWCHTTISSSAVPFSSCLQSFPASRSLQMSQVFESEGPSTRASVSASVLAMNIQCWFLLELAGFIFLLCKGLSEVFSSTTVWKHWFFDAQPSLWSSFHTCTWLLEKP